MPVFSNEELSVYVIIDIIADWVPYIILVLAAIAFAIWNWWTDLVMWFRSSKESKKLGDELTKNLPKDTKNIFDD